MRCFCSAVAGCLATALLSLAGCGTEPSLPFDPTGQGEGARPPAAGPQQPGDGDGVVLAVDRLFLGDTDWDGKKTPGSWKLYGFDIDGKVSTTASKDLCKPVAGAAPADVYPDGQDGIDNSFGKNLVELIANLLPDPSARVTEAIGNGDFTVMLKIEGLGEQASYNPLTTKLYGGAKLTPPPAWDGNDAWPVIPELLGDAQDIDSATVVFPDSYVVDNIWVSGGESIFKLNLTIADTILGITISHATLAMELAADHKSVVMGTISGVVETEGLVNELRKVIGALAPNYCAPATLGPILNRIRSASDILKDGSQDPTQECDAISIGVGFTAKEVQLGPIAPAAMMEGTSACESAPSDGG